MGKRRGFILYESFTDERGKLYEIGYQVSITGREGIVGIVRCDCGYEIDSKIPRPDLETIFCDALNGCGREIKIPAYVRNRVYELNIKFREEMYRTGRWVGNAHNY